MILVCSLSFIIIILLIVIRKILEKRWKTYEIKICLKEKVFIITGANSGLGKATSKELVKKNATVIMACRNIQATNNAIKHIRKSIKTGKLIPMELDLASLKSIKEFVEKILKDFPKIDVLINNAGVCIPPNHNIKTKEGLEINFGVNYLGHFYLTNLLLDRLKESSPSKIVINGSVLQERGEIDFENFNGEKKLPEMTDIWENKAYNDSKLALYYFAKEFVRRNEKLQDVDIYILCPGFVFTNIGQYIHLKWFEYIKLLPRIYFYMKTPTQGAQTILKCATDPSFKNVTGHFFENCEYYDPKINIDNETALKLWKFSEKFCSNKDQ